MSGNIVSQGLVGTWWTSRWSTQLILLCLLVWVLLTRLVTTLRFRRAVSSPPGTNHASAPVVPYWIPGLYHLVPFLWNTADFPLSVVKRYGWERPVRFKAGGSDFVVIGNPDHITAVYKNSRFLSARSITERSARYLLDIPPEVMPFYQADDSGMAAEPRKGSQVAPENRILYQQTHTAQKYLASPHLDPTAGRYLRLLQRHVDGLGIGSDWVQLPDLYAFCQAAVTRGNVEAMVGSKLFDISPSFVDDFWRAKAFAPEYFRGWPRWLVPRAFAARDRVVDTIQRWHDYGLAHGDHTNTGPGDPDWEPIWGSKYSKIRQQFMLGMKPLTARVRAAEDWGLMFGANGNTAPTVFWYLLEALRDQGLAARMMAEVDGCISGQGDINARELGEQPLLQSVFSEVLRLRVSILVSRMVEQRDVTVAGYRLPRGTYVLMPTDAVHQGAAEAWERAGRPLRVPLEAFDAERFLIPSEAGPPTFSLDGLAGLWIPFGGGDRMCPGRHLAKLEVLATFAYLFSKYDIEIEGSDADRVGCDRRYAAFGMMPPNRRVPFRIRERKDSKV